MKCPRCENPMIKRVARRGPNSGKEFWGCSTYPDCREIVNIDGNTDKDVEVSDNSSILENSSVKGRILSSVNWSERLNRSNYISEFCTIGSKPDFLSTFDLLGHKGISQGVVQSLILSKRKGFSSVSEEVRNISHVLQKLLTRGALPKYSLRSSNPPIRTPSIKVCGVVARPCLVLKASTSSLLVKWRSSTSYPSRSSKSLDFRP